MADPNLTPDELERLFQAALAAADMQGMGAALTVLAVRDPHRAERLRTSALVALGAAAYLQERHPIGPAARVFADPAVLEEVRNAVEASCEAAHLDEGILQAIVWGVETILERRARGEHG